MTQSDQTPELSIDTPCPKTWAELDGDEGKRYCSKCDKHVHNGESMTKSEAVEFVRTGEGEICMRLVTDDAGTILYKDSPKKNKPKSMVRRAGLAIAAGGLVAACTSQPEKAHEPEPKPVTGTEQAGQGEHPITVDEPALEILGEIIVEPEEPEAPLSPEEAAAAALQKPLEVEYNMIGQVKVGGLEEMPDKRPLLGKVRMLLPDEQTEKDAAQCEGEKSSPEAPKEILGTPGPPPPKREILGTPAPQPPKPEPEPKPE